MKAGGAWKGVGRVDWRVLLPLAAAKLGGHMLVAGAYGFHRDELYYLTCGRHLALGYVDHPPLVPWLAAVSEALFGLSLSGLHLWPALAGAALVVLAGVLAASLGGGAYAQALAAGACLTCPLFVGANSLFQTVSFDQLAWALLLLVLVAILRREEPRKWLLFGLLAGLALLVKYTVLVLLLAIFVALLSTPERRRLASRWPWIAALLSLAIVLPNLIWQGRHGWPTLEFIANNRSGETTAPLEFLINQLAQMGPFSFPVYVGSLLFLFSRRGPAAETSRHRLLGWTAVSTLAVFALLGAKPYYPGPIYVLLFAAGGVYLEPRFRVPSKMLLARVVGALPFLLLLGNLAPLPVLLPLLPPEVYAERQERIGSADLAERFGWMELVEEVAEASRTLPTETADRVTIFTSNYGSASAIDLFGEPYGLPPAASGHNSYWWWTRGARLDPVIAVGFSRQSLERRWSEVTEIGTISNRYGIDNEEQGRPFFLCRGLRGESDELWTGLRHYD